MPRQIRRWAAIAAFFVCCGTAASPPQKKKAPPASPLDLNVATVEQLEQLPGIGPATAKAIVQFREKSGPYRRVEDLLAIRGITKRKLEKLRPYVTVQAAPKGGPAPANKPAEKLRERSPGLHKVWWVSWAFPTRMGTCSAISNP